MNRKSVEKIVAQKAGVRKNIVNKVFDCFYDLLLDALQKNENINFAGFAKFYTRQRKERTFVSFQTGESFVVPPKILPAIKFSKKFVEKL